MKTDKRQEVISALKGKFKVTQLERRYGNSELEIYGEFSYHERTGKFVYTLIGRETGVDETFGFEEQANEDIYTEINDWVDEHIETETIVKYDDKELK